MNVLVSSSQHYVLTQDGELWVSNAAEGYKFWSRYLDVYDEVRLCIRAAYRPSPPVGWIRSCGEGVQPIPLPDFYGPAAFLKEYRRIRQIMRQALGTPMAIQLRIPCPIGNEIWKMLAQQRPYGIEVISDPYDVFSSGAIHHPLRSFFRWYFPTVLRKQCQRACAAAYVTATSLQRRYPPGLNTVETNYSDVELTDSAFLKAPRKAKATLPIRLIMVGNLNQLYKAPDVLVEAMNICINQYALPIELVMVGDGQYREPLKAQVDTYGLTECVRFAGQLAARADVVAELDQADLFILPSRTEGLPRAMIEAMARALPCIGSAAGGIPELLSDDDLVPRGDALALANKIKEVVTDPERMTTMSARNLTNAQNFHEGILRERRLAFYQHVRNETGAWLEDRA
ncbi:MAG: glycosyltransferase [Chloroflexota bacterium]